MSMYQYTSKGYKYVERDNDDIPELWIVVKHGEEPPEDIDPDEDLWTVVCDYYTLSPTGEHPLSGKFQEAPNDTN